MRAEIEERARLVASWLAEEGPVSTLWPDERRHVADFVDHLDGFQPPVHAQSAGGMTRLFGRRSGRLRVEGRFGHPLEAGKFSGPQHPMGYRALVREVLCQRPSGAQLARRAGYLVGLVTSVRVRGGDVPDRVAEVVEELRDLLSAATAVGRLGGEVA